MEGRARRMVSYRPVPISGRREPRIRSANRPDYAENCQIRRRISLSMAKYARFAGESAVCVCLAAIPDAVPTVERRYLHRARQVAPS
jgi:hypothetical protein